MAGTGLPENKSQPVLAQAPPMIDGDKFSSAAAWGKIAAAAESVTKTAGDIYQKEQIQQQAATTADFENQNSDWFVKARDQYANDPTGFETAARAHMDGTLAQTPTWMVNHAKKFLGGKLETNLSVITTETRARNTTLAAQSVDARRVSADNDVMAIAMAGKVGSPEWIAANETYQGVVNTSVSSGLMAQEKADLLVEDLQGRAHGEVAARSGVDVYREKGPEAATQYLRESILENDKLSLKPAQRYAIFNRGVAAINLAKKEDQSDKVGVVEMARDLRARVSSGQAYDPGEVQDTLASLNRVGATADYQRLSRDVAVNKATAPYISGGAPLGEFGRAVQAMRAGPAVTSAIDQAAAKNALDPNFMRRVAQIESSGNPNARTGSYKGLFQMSDEEFAKYGGGDIYNPDDNAMAGGRKLAAEANRFAQSHGRQAMPVDIYLTHQQGEAGYNAHLAKPGGVA